MITKKIGVFIALILSSLMAVFVLHQGADILGKSSSSQTQNSVNHSCPQDMVWIRGGSFKIGDDEHYIEEQSAKDVRVDGFCMDQHEITNGQFAEFVKETGYITVAERPLSAAEFPQLSEEQRAPGSLVFVQPSGSKVKELGWWHWVTGANWQHPEGVDSSIEGKENYPVVQVAYEDAQAYAEWAGKSLPTESQWEFAAKGGLKNATFTWGNSYSADKANTWQGKFPFKNLEKDGYYGTAPVESFAANGYGLYDMAGNVWEWTVDWYRLGHKGKEHQVNPTVADASKSLDPREPGVAKHVIKGGSFLCAQNYCSRFRPAAREAQSPDTGTSHIGFRLVS